MDKNEETVVLTEEYFKGMQRMLNDILPDIEINNISAIQKIARLNDWLRFSKVKRESDKYRTHHNAHTKETFEENNIPKKDNL